MEDKDELIGLGQSFSSLPFSFSRAEYLLISPLLTVLRAAQKAARSASYHDSSNYLEACERIVDFGDKTTWERSRESCFFFVTIFAEVSAVLRRSDVAITRVSTPSIRACFGSVERALTSHVRIQIHAMLAFCSTPLEELNLQVKPYPLLIARL